ncbi:MAG TPA: DUF2785 domain-containing protein [Vicinamibacterales bacterium]|nr:DUF2785 domain-containing protein [Vicinamibacterales bacterium]
MNCAAASLLALVTCLGDPDPSVRDKIAFERLSAMLRGGDVDTATLATLNRQLQAEVAADDPQGFRRPFVILALAEVARTDRIKPWMDDRDRRQLVGVAAGYLSTLTDYRAFDDKQGFRHGVAHGADLAMQLALNAAVDKPQLDRLLEAIRVQATPRDASIAYWAGEPDRLARALLFIAQRKLHSEAEWKAWFEALMNPKPLPAWNTAFSSEAGIRKRHNARAFLLSVFATASTAEDAGIKLLLTPARDALKLVP